MMIESIPGHEMTYSRMYEEPEMDIRISVTIDTLADPDQLLTVFARMSHRFYLDLASEIKTEEV